MLEMNMELTKIEIENSKSIKSPITISFTEGLPTILIGKNGCGKTNILEALSYIVWGRPWYPNLQNVEFPKYRAYIQISKKEVIPTHIKYDKSKGEIVAYDIGKGLEIDRLEEHLPPLIKEQCAKISELISKLQETLGKYKEQIEKIAHKGNGFESKLCCYQIYDNENRLTTYTEICNDTKRFIENIKKSIGKIQEKLSLDEKEIKKIRFTYDSTIYFTPELNFKLEYVEPNISEFAQSFVSIDKEAIKCAIEEINKQTKDSCECMEKLIKEINEIIKRAEENLLSFSALKDSRNEQYDSILRKVKKAIAKNCQFLRNESQDVIFRNHLQESRLRNASEIIMETYFCQVYDGPDKDKLCKEIREGNIPHIQEQDIKDFEDFLNKNIPNFDKGMYKSISVVKKEGLNILLNEKTGDTVELDKTSAGRRWYFTYYFMKSILRPGDMFIIDEPASGLHPCAQSDILKELMQLSKSGIKVVYSTHSPYLIPKEEWKSVHFVTMMDDGTQVNSVSSNKEVISQMKDVFAEDIFYIQYVFELYTGDQHKIAKNCYKAVKEKDKTLENAAREMVISKPTIESWNRNGKHFRCPKFENVFRVSRYVNIDIKDLLN